MTTSWEARMTNDVENTDSYLLISTLEARTNMIKFVRSFNFFANSVQEKPWCFFLKGFMKALSVIYCSSSFRANSH